ncbi:hypothetical protein F5888DRAFT_1308766 [Russula emetica]|nr:hypothetical protein F5888DRAFT_1308766 [Russula emetica]
MMKSTFHHEKRHTKPCRFFQKGLCPLSADRCDFAHVKIHILPVKYPSDHLKPLQDGQCDYRDSHQLAAPAKHNEIGMPKVATLHVDPGTESHPVEEVAALASPQTMGESTNSPAAVTKVAHGSRFSPHEPVLLPPVSGQPSGPNAACTTSVIPDDLTRVIFRNGDTSPTSDVPSLSDGDSDPPSAPYEVPEFPERWPGSATVQTRSPVVYCNPTPGFFSPGAPFVHPAYVPWTLAKPPARSDSRRHAMSTRKLKALKTKQCKFYKKDGRCPQGSLCTFIHDPSVLQSPQSEQESPSDGSAGSPLSPSESRSKSDEEHERNVYPITWRVIGGGVMMSGQRAICTRYKDGVCPDSDDCPYTHPWEDDIKTPIEATSSPTSTPRASYFPQAQTNRAVDMSTVQQPVPSVPELIPDLSPIAVGGRGSPSALSVRENMPPRPFSTPPRISSRAETDITRGA